MSIIEVFADVRCPFTHVGLRRLVARRDELGRSTALHVRAWPLELVNDAPLDPELIATEVVAIRDQVAPDLFTGFDPAAFPSSSLPALALSAAAQRIDPAVGEAMALDLRTALFEQGRDVGDDAVLADLAARHGIEAVTAEDHEQVRADWREGQERGVIGSPHFIVDGEGFFCPSLDISHDDAGFHIHPDMAAFDAFAARALRD